MLMGFVGLLVLLSAQAARLQLVCHYPLGYGQRYNTQVLSDTSPVFAADVSSGAVVVP
jgi:hypothetical protein